MKKIILFIAVLFIFTSCISYVCVREADIIVFNSLGEPTYEYCGVRLYDDCFKPYGLNFMYESEGVIISNSTPYIIYYSEYLIEAEDTTKLEQINTDYR